MASHHQAFFVDLRKSPTNNKQKGHKTPDKDRTGATSPLGLQVKRNTVPAVSVEFQ
jgi:hypothetical protein